MYQAATVQQLGQASCLTSRVERNISSSVTLSSVQSVAKCVGRPQSTVQPRGAGGPHGHEGATNNLECIPVLRA